MVATAFLTFVITALSMFVIFLLDDSRKQNAKYNRLWKENANPRRQITEYDTTERRRNERSAYDKGLHDGRATDTLYRSILKKYSAKEQVDVMMNGSEPEIKEEKKA